MVGEESTDEYGGVRKGTESYRFAVDEEGNQLFNIENVGKLSLESLLKNNSIT